MQHFYDPKTESTMHRIDTLHSGFIATLHLALGERRRKKSSLQEQALNDIISITTSTRTQAFINVTETDRHGKKKAVCLVLSLKDTIWTYSRRCWQPKAEIIAWSGQEKV